MDAWVGVGTAAAVLIIVLRCIGPKHWLHPKAWRIPDIGAAFFVFVGVNTITEAFKVASLLAEGRIVISNGEIGKLATYASVGTEDSVFFVAGVAAGVIVGIISIRDGLRKLPGDATELHGLRLRMPPSPSISEADSPQTASDSDTNGHASEILDSTS